MAPSIRTETMNAWRNRPRSIVTLFIGVFFLFVLFYLLWPDSGSSHSGDVFPSTGNDPDISSIAFKTRVTITSTPLTRATAQLSSANVHYAVSDIIGKPESRSFGIDGNHFVKDGKQFAFRAGTAHYWRRPPEHWEDTMVKIKALGLNAVQTYVSWNLHEPEPEQYDFQKALDIRRYCQLAQKHGLLVILRPGPFINAEVDMGGLPYWLLRINPEMTVRTSDKSYFQYVERWYRTLLPMLRDLLFVNGGPVAMVQVGNEYGSYNACDMSYLHSLRDLTRELVGPDTLLYTTDGSSAIKRNYMQCGKIQNVVTTVDFGAGADVQQSLSIFREWVPVGPFMNSEFYPGWINHWGRLWNTVPTEKVIKTTTELLDLGASFTFYPIVGGTNFGFVVGANNYSSTFSPGTTSYDFDAPITEAGDLTDKYIQLKELFRKRNLVPDTEILPGSREKYAYGRVAMTFSGNIFDNLANLSPRAATKSDRPMTFEELYHPYGFVLYRTTINQKTHDPARLIIKGLHDRAVVMINQRRQGILSRTSGLVELNIFARSGDTLDILVQSEGRLTVGDYMNDFKGIVGDVFLNNEVVTSWTHYPVMLPGYPVHNPTVLSLVANAEPANTNVDLPAFYTGKFNVSLPCDTFLRLAVWRQGYAFVNGYNLGRYWPAVGPQLTLFVPAVFLRENAENVLQIFEVDSSPCKKYENCYVQFIGSPEVSGTVEKVHNIH